MKTITATFQRGAEPPFTATGTFNIIPGMGDVVWQNVPDEFKHAARTKNYAEGFEHSMQSFAEYFKLKVSIKSEGDWIVCEM